MQQQFPFILRLFFCLLCGLIAWMAFAIASSNGDWSGRPWLALLSVLFIGLSLVSFSHPYFVLSCLSLAIGVLGVRFAIVQWEWDQLLPAMVGITILCLTYLSIRRLAKRKRISRVSQVVGGGAVAGCVSMGVGLFGYSSLGFLLLSTLFVAYGVAGIGAALTDVVDRRDSRSENAGASFTKPSPNPSIERTSPGLPEDAAHVER